MNTNPTPQHPGRLMLEFGGIQVVITPDESDPWVLRIDTRSTENSQSSVMRTYANTRGHIVYMREPLPASWRLWLACTVIELPPLQVQPAQEWAAAYSAWINTERAA